MAFKTIFEGIPPDQQWSMEAHVNQITQEPVAVLFSVPLDLDEDGVRNICSDYGNIVNVSRATYPTHHVYFVKYSNLSEAEQAVRGVNSDKKLNIRSALKKPKEIHDKLQSNRNRDNAKSNNNNVNMKRKLIVPLSAPKEEISYKTPGNINISENDYKNSALNNVDPNKDFLCSPPQMKNSLNSNRKKNDNNRDFKNIISNNYNENLNCIQIKSNDNITKPLKSGKCINCGQISFYVCDRCKSFYCNKDCQIHDWPVHKQSCNLMPELRNLNTGEPFNSKNDYNSHSKIKPLIDYDTENWNNQNQRNRNENKLKNGSPNIKSISSTSTSSHCEVNQNYSMSDLQEQVKKISISNESQKKVPVAIPIFVVDFPKSKSRVCITAVLSSNTIFIRPMDKKSNTEYCEILEKISSASIDAESFTELPNVGEIVLAEFGNEGYYRALILKVIDKHSITVSYIDFGNSEIKSLDDLKILKNDLKGLKRFSLKAILKDVPNISKENCLDYLNKLCDDVIELQVIYDGDYILNKTSIELIEIKNNESVNKNIINLIDETQDDNEPIIFIDDIPKNILPDSKNVEVQILDNSCLINGIITCAFQEQSYDFHLMERAIQQYCSKLPSDINYTPRLKEVCLFKVGNLWFRGSCVETVGDGHPTIAFIDYGKFDIVNIKNIRRMPKEFIKQCNYGVSCLVNDVPDELETTHLKLLKEIFPENSTILIDEISTINLAEDDEKEEILTNVITLKKLENLFT